MASSAPWSPPASPVDECLGTDDCKNLKDRRKPALKQDEEPAIIVRKPDAAMKPAPQNNQLMPKRRVLNLKPHLRLEWRGQDGQDGNLAAIDLNSNHSSTPKLLSVWAPPAAPDLLRGLRPYLETAAKLLKLLERVLAVFSKCALKLLNNQADFDSAIRRFDPSRPSQRSDHP